MLAYGRLAKHPSPVAIVAPAEATRIAVRELSDALLVGHSQNHEAGLLEASGPGPERLRSRELWRQCPSVVRANPCPPTAEQCGYHGEGSSISPSTIAAGHCERPEMIWRGPTYVTTDVSIARRVDSRVIFDDIAATLQSEATRHSKSPKRSFE